MTAADRAAARSAARTWAGFRSCRFAKQNDRLIVVVHAHEAGIDSDPENPWATVCDDHGTICTHPTRTLAEQWAADPEGWCEPCREARKGPGSDVVDGDCDECGQTCDRAWDYLCDSCREAEDADAEGDPEEEPDDEPARSSEEWFYAYKAAEHAAGREPMAWGAWLAAGMPTPITTNP
jgi:hypothetical protein